MRKTLLTSLCCLSILGFARGSTLFADEPKDDVASQIYGKWKVISVERNGVVMPASEIENLQMIFAKDSIKIVRDGKEDGEPIKYSHDSTKTPRHIDLTNTHTVTTLEGKKLKGESRTEQIKGLYEIKPDTLTLCLSEKGDSPRPESLSPKNRTGTSIAVLKRVK